MANKFTYDTTNKLFILNNGVTSLDMKSEFYSWVKTDWKNNEILNKFRFPILAIGGQTVAAGQVISPYYQLLYGWKIRPQEADHILTILGNVITSDNSDPFVSTVGTFNVRVKFVVSSNSISAGSGLDSTQNTWLDELYKLAGLKTGNPLTVSTTQRQAGAITQTISENAGVVTVTRQ